MTISATKFQSVHKSLSALAQKVYAAVPLSEPWSVSYIYSEILRMGSSTRDVSTVLGCLNTLKEAGLVLEPSRGVFLRTPMKSEKETVKETVVKPNPIGIIQMTPVKSPATRSPMLVLSELSTRFRALADDMETAALEIDEMFTAKSAGAEKLAQLQQLLKSIA